MELILKNVDANIPTEYAWKLTVKSYFLIRK